MPKRNKQKNKALTNNQTPTETLFNQEVSSELVDNGENKSNHKHQKKSNSSSES
ncbi:hypothetical protein [Alkalicoccobacillus plakortidis]|uniref:Glycogen biosynthesis protein GlgD n=1 Tax=Alkalicoccobacillus plakortidis TaxID=444060 RepID=A0ABT0XNH8_9BACI|nr:hypothetical protein [Alkalicoccobacillus plakortidis]MCM2676799.1 hypothetical protein [Alkalicoccobacillus plakortidis]